MKKFALAAVAAAALSAGVAQAYTVGTFSNGVVVPNVIHAAGETTAVGLINGGDNNIAVFWTFFDQDSTHITDGCFPMTGKQYRGFNWATESGVGLENKRGYLVFAVGSTTAGNAPSGNCQTATPGLAGGADSNVLSANAFHVQLGKSVAFTPVIDGPLVMANNTNLSTMDADSLQYVGGAAPKNETLYMRYFIDGVLDKGDDTRIAVWSVGDQKGTHTVNIYDSAQNRKSVNFKLDHKELSWFDPETIPGRPTNFTDGFITWNVNDSGIDSPPALPLPHVRGTHGVVMSYSTIISPAFGAVQTLMGAHRAN